MGKTTVACAIANKALEQNWAVHISSLEMTSVDLLEIMVENDINKGTRDSVSKQIAYTKHKELLRRRLSMSDSGGQNVGDIFSHVLSAQARQMNDGAVGMLLLVDYIQLLDATGTYNARHLEVASVSKAFVTLKKILSENGPAHIMVLAQLNRNVEERQNKKPVMADLKDSGSLEQDADAIFLLYRDYYYNREVPPEEQHNLEVIIDKNRFGTVGSVETKIDLATKQWYNEVSPQDNNEYLTDDPAMFGDT
jgi:replicative DNA helicase